MIKYQSGSIANAPIPSIVIHSCNCKGIWGAGVAKYFATSFPDAYQQYQQYCRKGAKVGDALLIPTKSKVVGCLFTSWGFGSEKDSPSEILLATNKALDNLFYAIEERGYRYLPIHSPKINSGLFSVPWEQTERLIESKILNSQIKWTIWCL